MAYYHTCPDCGANLDPGEKCDCQTNKIYITKEANTNVRNESNDHGCHGPYGSAQQHCRREVWRIPQATPITARITAAVSLPCSFLPNSQIRPTGLCSFII